MPKTVVWSFAWSVLIGLSTAPMSAIRASESDLRGNGETVVVAQTSVRATTESDSGDQGVSYGEPLASGKVIVKGALLAGPYRVGSRGGEVFVNGQQVAVLQDSQHELQQAAATERQNHPVVRLVAAIERHLLDDQVLLVFDKYTRAITDEETAADFINDLARARSLRERVLVAMSVELGDTEDVSTAQWREVLADFQLTEDLRQFVTACEDGEDEEDEDVSTVVCRRETTSQNMCVLSVVGMILAVLSVGILLSCHPDSIGGWSAVADSTSRIRLIGQCLLLVVVLSVFDLACTLLVGARGHLEELNPVANSLLATPAALIAFKLTTTAIGAGILWSLRRYAGAQLASWWLCLLLTILTARWVTIQSLFFV
jgi:hypothetical protein